MALVIDSQTVHKAHRQHFIDLLDQLAYLSATVQDIRERKRCLFEEQQTLSEQQQLLFQQRLALSHEESILLEEAKAILVELSHVRYYKQYR